MLFSFFHKFITLKGGGGGYVGVGGGGGGGGWIRWRGGGGCVDTLGVDTLGWGGGGLT